MKIIAIVMLTVLPLGASLAWSGDLTTDAAIGGAIGGALGGVLGAQAGGRQGAVIGAGIGGATGAAISTQGDGGGYRDERYYEGRPYREEHRHHEYDDDDYDRPSHFCPPGQAKKGRC